MAVEMSAHLDSAMAAIGCLEIIEPGRRLDFERACDLIVKARLVLNGEELVPAAICGLPIDSGLAAHGIDRD